MRSATADAFARLVAVDLPVGFAVPGLVAAFFDFRVLGPEDSGSPSNICANVLGEHQRGSTQSQTKCGGTQKRCAQYCVSSHYYSPYCCLDCVFETNLG